jgi:Protein of unknown function (DUF3632)
MIWTTSLFFSRGYPISPEKQDDGVHQLWHAYFHASRNIKDRSGKQDRLIVQLLSAREMGVLSRKKTDEHGAVVVEEAVTTGGARIWRDLPFLVEDMTGFWLREPGTPTNRQNFASFLAKLVAVGVNDRLCGCALSILRDALETDHPIRTEEGGGGGTVEELSIRELLNIVNPWIFYAGSAILRLSENSDNAFPDKLARLGNLALAAGVDRSGFSVQRCLFWMDRLGQIAAALPSADAENVLRERHSFVSIALQFDYEITRQFVQRGWWSD